MARVTTDDCLDKIPNRFELILIACKRAQQIDKHGKAPMIDNTDNHKPAVVALKEIAASKVDSSILQELDDSHKFQTEQNESDSELPEPVTH